MIKRILLVLVILAAGYGIYRAVQGFTSWREHVIKEKSEVLLEKIKTVAKLITVEGHFSEVYDYKDYWGYDIGLFRKKALVRVKGKVSVGYDLSEMEIQSFPERKVIYISRMPAPGILSLEHDLDYYDISEGTFNSFNPEDYNRINQGAKDKIREQAENSDLFEAAERQSAKMLEMLEIMIESSGWTLEVEEKKMFNN